MSSKEVRVYLMDILEEIKNSQSFLGRIASFEKFAKNRRAVYACSRSLEILGEAVKRMPGEFCKKHPEIPWKEIAGMRDKLIHDYSGARIGVIWKTIKDDLPKLKIQAEEVLEQLPLEKK